MSKAISQIILLVVSVLGNPELREWLCREGTPHSHMHTQGRGHATMKKRAGLWPLKDDLLTRLEYFVGPQYLCETHCKTATLISQLLLAENLVKDGLSPTLHWTRALYLSFRLPLRTPVTGSFCKNRLSELLQDWFNTVHWGLLGTSQQQWPLFAIVSRFAGSLKARLLKSGFAESARILVAGEDGIATETQNTNIKHIDQGDNHTQRRKLEIFKSAFRTSYLALQVLGNTSEMASRFAVQEHAAKAQTHLRSWLQHFVSVRPNSTDLFLSVLILAGELVGFWEQLDQLLLPSSVELRLPDAITEYKSHLAIFGKPRAGPQCAPSLHCKRFWDTGDAAYTSAFSRHDEGHCRIRMYVGKIRSLMTDEVRTYCRALCNIVVLGLLHSLGRSLVRTDPSQVFRYVQVGAALGSCVLAAASMLPEGSLHALALEPLAVNAGLIRQSLAANRLSALPGTPNNASRVVLRQIALGDGKRQFMYGASQHVGFQPWHSDRRHNEVKLRSSTLDKQLQFYKDGQADLVSIFVNGVELSVLQGARVSLQQQRIKCLAVNMFNLPADVTEQHLVAFLNEFGYSSERCEKDSYWLCSSPRLSNKTVRPCSSPWP